MTKTINLELSKRLAPYLEGVETEFAYIWTMSRDLVKDEYIEKPVAKWQIRASYFSPLPDIKTLTLEEAIDFLPYRQNQKWRVDRVHTLSIFKKQDDYFVAYYWEINWFLEEIKIQNGKTLLEAIESMITHLLDNNLLK